MVPANAAATEHRPATARVTRMVATRPNRSETEPQTGCDRP